jgi:hypothetical protein
MMWGIYLTVASIIPTGMYGMANSSLGEISTHSAQLRSFQGLVSGHPATMP